MDQKKLQEDELLCPNCKTGQDTFLLDERNPFCPYLACHSGKECSKFVPVKMRDM